MAAIKFNFTTDATSLDGTEETLVEVLTSEYDLSEGYSARVMFMFHLTRKEFEDFVRQGREYFSKS